MPDIEKPLLDDIEELIKLHVGPDEAITAGEIADELGIDDTAGNPRTREAIRALMKGRKIPIAAGGNGYYLLDELEDVERYLRNLQNRINGIQDRMESVNTAWRATHDREPEPYRTEYPDWSEWESEA